MNQPTEVHDAPLPALDLNAGYQLALVVLILCITSGLINQFTLAGICFVYFFGPLVVKFLRLIDEFAVSSGKYISKEVSAYTDASEGIRPRSIWAHEEGPKKPLVMIHHQEPAPQVEPPSSVPPPLTGKSFPSLDSMPLFRNSIARNTPYCPTAFSPRTPFGSVDLREVGSAPSSGTSPAPPVASLKAEPDTRDETVDGCVSLENDDSLQIEQKSGGAFELESRTIGSLTDRWGFEEEEDDESPRRFPRVGAGLVLKRLVKPEVVSEVGGWLSRLSIAGQGCSTISVLQALKTAPKSDVQRVARDRVAKLRSQRPKRSQVDGVPAKRRGVMKGMAGKPRRSVKKEVRAESAAETEEKMVGLEFETIEATMIGSDVDGEMDETPDSDGDSSSVVEDPMELEEDGPADSMQLDDDGPQAGSSASKGKKPQYDRVKVAFETLRGRYERGVAGLGFRQSSENEVSSRKIVSGSVGAPVQLPSQQQAAPVSTSVTRQAADGALQGIAQHLVSTNSAADLREARQGKRAETSAAPSPSFGAPSTTTADENTSDTTQPTTTPASTLPSSISSTPPATPSATDTNASAPERQDRKRGCEESVDEADKDPRDQPALGSGPSKVSAARRVLLAKAGKRSLRSGPKVGTVANDPRVEASESSRGSEPETTPGPESSKRVQRERPGDAEAGQEVVPLNEVPDKTLTGKFISQKRTSPHIAHETASYNHLTSSLKQSPSTIIRVEDGALTLNIAEQEKVAQLLEAVWPSFPHDAPSSDDESS